LNLISKEIEIIRTLNSSYTAKLIDKYEEKEYFDVIADEQEWTTFYAMNWQNFLV
jgi:hypothetical protein